LKAFMALGKRNDTSGEDRAGGTHMAGGLAILALMLVRFIVRVRTSRPAAATTGCPWLDRIAPITHYGFCVPVLLMRRPAHVLRATHVTLGSGRVASLPGIASGAP
jgi:cytochrome b561